MSVPMSVGVAGHNKLTVNYRRMEMSNPDCSAVVRNVGSNQEHIFITVWDKDNPHDERKAQSNSFRAGAIQVVTTNTRKLLKDLKYF